jgi:hypothetical protein
MEYEDAVPVCDERQCTLTVMQPFELVEVIGCEIISLGFEAGFQNRHRVAELYYNGTVHSGE